MPRVRANPEYSIETKSVGPELLKKPLFVNLARILKKLESFKKPLLFTFYRKCRFFPCTCHNFSGTK